MEEKDYIFNELYDQVNQKYLATACGLIQTIGIVCTTDAIGVPLMLKRQKQVFKFWNQDVKAIKKAHKIQRKQLKTAVKNAYNNHKKVQVAITEITKDTTPSTLPAVKVGTHE